MQPNAIIAERDAVLNSCYAKLFSKDQDGSFRSIYSEDFGTVGWVGLTPAMFLSETTTGGNDPEDRHLLFRKYFVHTAFKFLVASVMKITTPALKLKKQYAANYRFKLVDDFGYKVTEKAKFSSKTIPDLLTLDKHSQIIFYDRMIKPNDKKSLDKKMGKKTVCKLWCTEMNAKPLYYRQMWSYSFWPSRAVCIGMLNSSSDVFHHYGLNLNVHKHIEMQVYDEDSFEWKHCTVDMNMFENPQTMLEEPVLYGMFSNDSPMEEIERSKHLVEYYFLDLVNCDSKEVCKPGGNTVATSALVTATIRKECPGLIQCLFWALENVSGSPYNITCNYTSDIIPNKYSTTPISSNSLDTKKGAKFDAMPTELFEDCLAIDTFNMSSTKVGIPAFPCVQQLGDGNNGGSRLQNLKTVITCTIPRAKDPSLDYEYMLRFRVLTLKQYAIINGTIVLNTE